MMKVDLLQLEELHQVVYLFEDILNSYCFIMNYILCFVNIMLMFSKMTWNHSSMTLSLCLHLWEIQAQRKMWRVRFWRKLKMRMRVLSINFECVDFTLIVLDFFLFFNVVFSWLFLLRCKEFVLSTCCRHFCNSC